MQILKYNLQILRNIRFSLISVDVLAALTRAVQSTIQSVITNSTRQQYEPCWDKFTTFCAEHRLLTLPASTSTVLLFLEWIKQKSGCFSPLIMHSAAISRFHVENGYVSPTRHASVSAFIKGARKLLGKPAQPKAALTKVLIKKIVDTCVGEAGPDEQSRLDFFREAIFEVSAFLGMCRFSDLVRVKWEDVHINSEFVVINFKTRKNDQVHKGHSVKLLYTGGRYCPVALFSRFRERLGRAVGGNYPKGGFLLPKIEKLRGQYRPVAGKAVSRSGMRAVQKNVMMKSGIDFRIFGLHSGKNGGATLAAFVKRHTLAERTAYGGWSKHSLMADHYDQTLMARACEEIGMTLRILDE
jgi:integrase